LNVRFLMLSALGFIGFFVNVKSTFAQQCSDCDCYHLPMPETCLTCCRVATGTITSATDSSVTLRMKTGTGEKDRTFQLGEKTKKSGTLKEGASATVYFREKGQIAAQINLLDQLQGLLVPGDEPNPPTPCPVPTSALRVYLGASVGWTSSNEATVLTIAEHPVLSVRRTSTGLAILAKVISDDGKIVAEIVDNRFYVNPNNFFSIEQPDRHSLVVYDERGTKALDIKYLNPLSVRVLGEFRFPGASPVIIAPDELKMGGTTMVGGCVGNSPSLIVVQ